MGRKNKLNKQTGLIKHDDVVRKLANYIQAKSNRLKDNTKILTFYEYHSGRRNGEVDLLSITSKHYYRFYEIKSHDSSSNYRKAQKQYNRFKTTYSDKQTKGIYVTPTRVRRLR